MGTVSVFLDADEISAETFGVDVNRGRSLESEDFGPGGGTIRVRNRSANFNPYFLVETSALLLESGDNLLLENGDRLLLEAGNGVGAGQYGDIKLGRTITVVDGGVTVFTGFVEDIDFTYGKNEATAVLTVRDALASLGSTDLKGWVPEQQLTGARVSALLDRPEVGFPSGASKRSIATGSQPLLAGSATVESDGSINYGPGSIPYGTNALQEFQRVNRAENGRGFVARDGKLVFQDRYAVFGVAPSATFGSGNLPIAGIEIRFGTELLHFAVSVSRDGSDAEQYVENAGLIAEYPDLGVRHKSFNDLPFNSDDHALGLAQLTLERFSSFDAVFSGLKVKLGKLNPTDRATVAAIDIGDTVVITWTPTGATGPVTQTVAVEAVTYSMERSPIDATVTFQLSSASDPGYFVLDTDALDSPAALAP